MTNEDAIKGLSNLKQDIGQSRHEDLWPYAQAIDEIIITLKEQEPYVSEETRLNRDEYCRVGDVLDCFNGMDMKADEVFHAVCLIEWAMSKRSVSLDQLLKDQEAVEPEECDIPGEVRCRRCGSSLMRETGYRFRHCPWCGRKVKWQ